MIATGSVFPRSRVSNSLPRRSGISITCRKFWSTVLLATLCAALSRENVLPSMAKALLLVGEKLWEKSSRRTVLIVGEVGLSVILSAGAGLPVQSLARLAATPLGFRTDHLLTASVHLPNKRYSSSDEKVQFFHRLAEQIDSISGVRGVSLGRLGSPAGHGRGRGFGAPDDTAAAGRFG